MRLSGTGSDGTRGAQAVRQRGGLIVAQDPETCAFDGMPSSLIEAGLTDLILAPEDIIEHIVQVASGEDESSAKSPRSNSPSTLMNARTSCVSCSSGSPGSSVTRLPSRPFRLPFASWWRRMEPPRCGCGSRAARRAKRLTRWQSRCTKVVSAVEGHAGFRIFATDVNGTAVETASRGIYPPTIAHDLPPDVLETYFVPNGQGAFVVRKSLRDLILFSRHNALRDPPFSNIDIVVCRNVLIYFRHHVQARLAEAFAFSLKPGGLLWLGSSESIASDQVAFDTLDHNWRIFRSSGKRAPSTLSRPPSPNFRVHQTSRRAPGPLPMARTQTDPAPLTTATHLALQQGFVPPFLLVDENLQLVFRQGDLDPLLRIPEGESTLDVRALVPTDLAILISANWDKLERATSDLVYENVGIQAPEGLRRVTLRFRRVVREGGKAPLMAVFVPENLVPKPGDKAPSPSLPEEIRERISGLEAALENSNKELGNVVHDLETSNEELQSTNEELLSSNEELKSLNEELQSVNEELHTVNAEFQAKVEELATVNYDLQTLLAGLNVGVVFMDHKLRIRRFNTMASQQMHLLEADIGRPLSHLNHGLDADALLRACTESLKTQRSSSFLCKARANQTVSVNVSVVEASDEGQGGVIVTTIESGLTVDLKQRLLRTLDTSGIAAAILTGSGEIVATTHPFADRFQRDRRWLVGTSIGVLLAQGDRFAFEERLANARAGNVSEYSFVAPLPDGGSLLESMRAIPLLEEESETFTLYVSLMSHAA
ncbi:MAG: PAS domain-containing protein [Myxococcales bacterium]|nr:PAS domain-containing protein [Myxococcales bacterium]